MVRGGVKSKRKKRKTKTIRKRAYINLLGGWPLFSFSSSVLFSPAAGPTTYTCFSTQLLFLSFHLSLPTILFLYHFPHPRQHVSFPFLLINFFSSFSCSSARLSLLLFKSLSSLDFYSLMLSLPFLLFKSLFSLSIVS